MRIVFGAVIAACLAVSALAQDSASGDRSEYTRFEDCEDRDPGPLAPYLQVCTTPYGYDIWFPYSEHSSAMAFGPKGIEAQLDQRPVLSGLDMVIGPVMDWRFRDGETRPYAAIMRYRGQTPVYDQDTAEFTGETETNSNILVVIALPEDGPVSACHVAYIDAMEVPGANEIAHRVASIYAPGFQCGQSETMGLDLFSVESLGLLD